MSRGRLSSLLDEVSGRTLKGEYIVVISGKDVDIILPAGDEETE